MLWGIKVVWEYVPDWQTLVGLARLRRREQRVVPGWYQQALVRERFRRTNAGRYSLSVTETD